MSGELRNSAKPLLKGAALLSIGQVAGYGLSLARNLILARLLTKADFGLAAALVMTISLLELVSRMAFGTQIIQARDGDDPVFQVAAHTVQLAFGLGSALIVIVCAYPMARVFSVPEQTWAFALLAIVPLARGAMHLDLSRLQRHLNYRPFVLMEVFSQSIATAATWPLAIWLGDFRAVLWIMIGKELLAVIFSHLFADRPYRCGWNRSKVRQMIVFGWPLLLNGLVMFASQQGDQMLVGATFSFEELAPYTIAFTLTSIPFFIYGQVGSSLILPLLSRHQNEPLRFEFYYRRCLEISVVVALVLVGPMVVAGGDIVRLLYGPKYSNVGGLMAIFGIIVSLRFFRWAPAVASMSRADTMNQLIGNIARSISFIFAIAVILLGARNLIVMAASGLVGEALAIIMTVYRIRSRLKIRLMAHSKPLLFLVGWILAGLAVSQCLERGFPIWIWSVVAVAFCFIGFLAAFFCFPILASLFKQIFLVPLLFDRKRAK